MATILKQGMKGPEVLAIQKQLVSLGYQIEPDGVFGGNTYKAVVAFQTRYNLNPDGVVGDNTRRVMSAPNQTLNALTEEDYAWAAAFLKDDVPSVKAVKEVEAPNGGFLKDGRVTILYERHVMYRQLYANGIDPDVWANKYPEIVNKKTGGYQGGAKEHDRLAQAKTIHLKSALESASWGAYQIMGFHWKSLGFSSVEEFVAAMSQSERKQLEVFVKFISNDPVLLKAIRNDDWPAFAKRYNGSNYAKNKYDVKLEAAFRKYGGK